MRRFWDFASDNPFIFLLIVGAIIAGIVKITTGTDFKF